jgi:methyl-accepting chemotaxis protein PixJ
MNIVNPSKSAARLTPPRLQSFLQRRLVGTIAIAILLSFSLTGAATWNVWQTSTNLKTAISRQTNLQELSSKLALLDSNISENMMTEPGQMLWEKTYHDNAIDLNQVTTDLQQDTPANVRDVLQQVAISAKKIIAIEQQTFDLVRGKKLEEASAMMTGSKYSQEKKLYSQSIQTIINGIKENINSQILAQRQALDLSILLIIVSLLLMLLIGCTVLIIVQGYIRDQQKSRQAIQTFQDNLLQLNTELQEESHLRSSQQIEVVQNNETLQADVGHILDVVCAVEGGDLTVTAEVNERATGLVSDTLNRLIESFHNIISVVISSAHQVTDRAADLDRLALETSSQAQNQTQSIQQVESLIAQVNKLTINSRQQAIETTSAVQLAKIAIGSGQEEMNEMVGGIEKLQQGTEQIVKRMQVLNDFVELAAQFSKDQKRVAALTRVLALNASLLSTRAVKEQDPEQFASIANEFETVAIQVNELAIDTNRSLVMLQQRTHQIQTVTSGLDQDVLDINQLVQKFTSEIGKSRQAFHNIQAVTEQVATMGEQVQTSSQDIVKVVRDALNAIQSIGIIAQNTENKANITREQVQTMVELAEKLLARVEFFQIQPVTGLLSGTQLPADSTAVPHSTDISWNQLAIAPAHHY